MRILLVNYMETTAPGGINKTVMELANGFSKNHDVVVLQSNHYNLPEDQMFNDFRIIRVKSRFENFLYGLSPELYLFNKKKKLKFNPDIIHIHGYHSLFSFQTICQMKKNYPKVPIIFSPHYGIFSNSTFAGKHLLGLYNVFLGKKYANYADLIIGASKFESDNLINILKFPKEKIVTIPHGVDKIDLKKSDRNKKNINLLYVGYLLEIKGVQFIIKVLPELIHRNVNVCLTIIGEGPFENELKKLAIKIGVNKFIKWRKFISPIENEKLQEYYKNSDLLLLLSKSENYGIVVQESLAVGTPVIVSNRTALKEFINEPGCFGVEYPPDPETLAAKIIKINNEKIEIGNFSDKIRIWRDIIIEYENLYNLWVK